MQEFPHLSFGFLTREAAASLCQTGDPDAFSNSRALHATTQLAEVFNHPSRKLPASTDESLCVHPVPLRWLAFRKNAVTAFNGYAGLCAVQSLYDSAQIR